LSESEGILNRSDSFAIFPQSLHRYIFSLSSIIFE